MKSKKYYEVRESIVASCYRLEIGGFQVCNNKTREKRFFARNDMDEFKIWYQEQLEEGTDEKSIDIDWIRTGAAESDMMDSAVFCYARDNATANDRFPQIVS